MILKVLKIEVVGQHIFKEGHILPNHWTLIGLDESQKLLKKSLKVIVLNAEDYLLLELWWFYESWEMLEKMQLNDSSDCLTQPHHIFALIYKSKTF